MITEIALVAIVVLGLFGLKVVSKRRVESPVQVAMVTVKAIPFGSVTELELMPRQTEETSLEKAYAAMPLKWMLTGSRYSSLSPLVLGIITVLIWVPMIFLFTQCLRYLSWFGLVCFSSLSKSVSALLSIFEEELARRHKGEAKSSKYKPARTVGISNLPGNEIRWRRADNTVHLPTIRTSYVPSPFLLLRL
jgi:hypothetical protein